MEFFGPLGLFLGLGANFFLLGVRLKKFFETYKCRLSILVLELQPYLFFNSVHLGHFCALLGYFFWLGSYPKSYLGPTYIDSQLLFWKYMVYIAL